MIEFMETQRLIWMNRVYPLYKMSDPGGVLALEASSLSPGRYLWRKLMKK